MANEEQVAFKATTELGKIYLSIIDKQTLCDFFLDSVEPFIHPTESYLFLSGTDNQIWLVSSLGVRGDIRKEIESRSREILIEGKPLLDNDILFVPLVARNSAIGVATFFRKGSPFTRQDLDTVFSLASQISGALKNLLLFEENLRMERLATVGQTVGMVMHEIKNIIQIAKLGDELVRRGLKDQNQKFITHGMEGMAKAIKDMDGFVWDMLSLTKDFKVEPKKISWETLLDEMKNDLKEKAEQLQVRLDFSVERDFLPPDGEPRSLYRTLLNLVQNAIEACDKDDAFIRVRVQSKDKEHYEVIIEDNGKGMSAEVKARLFEGFYTTKGRKGNGIGMMIIEKTIKAHRGTIHVESESGKGTSFTMVLPKELPKEN